MKKPYPASMYCPCGSGLKYRSCCRPAGIEYFVGKGGKLTKRMPLTPEREALFQEELRRFVESHGRPPSEKEEAVLRQAGFESVEEVIAREALAAGADPAEVYAFEKTGILVTRENRHQIPPQELARWEEAVEEYRLNQLL